MQISSKNLCDIADITTRHQVSCDLFFIHFFSINLIIIYIKVFFFFNYQLYGIFKKEFFKFIFESIFFFYVYVNVLFCIIAGFKIYIYFYDIDCL